MMLEQIEQATSYIQKHITEPIQIGLVLGSGLSTLGDELENRRTIAYEKIPHFPTSTVAGHEGQLALGHLSGKKVLAMQGRFHFYEGYSMDEVTFPIRVMKALGIDTVIITNAAGGINETFSPGDLMVITDHINMTGTNPLIGPNDPALGERFPDLTKAYDDWMIEHAQSTAKQLNINLQTGVYVGNSGPTYETPAEVRMLGKLGGDAVGMSTVPEVIVARHANLRVLGISCISNMAAGINNEQLSHDQVVATAKTSERDFKLLVKNIIKNL